jgi:hypothetical protein
MSFVYCLYSTENGVPRYVGQTCAAVGDRLNQHFRDASRQGRSKLHRWIRTAQSRGFEVRAHLLQVAVHPADMNFYEHYWRQQFAGLLNRTGRAERRRHTPVGEAVERALHRTLEAPRARSSSFASFIKIGRKNASVLPDPVPVVANTHCPTGSAMISSASA